MKKIGIILISFVLLSASAGCRQSIPSGDELLPHSPTATPNVSISDGIVTFENTARDAYLDEYHNYVHQLYELNRPWAEKDSVCLDFLIQKLEFEKAEYLYTDSMNQETVNACMDWISCLYDTKYYEDSEMFQKNIEYRRPYLQEGLDFNNLLETHIKTLSGIQQTLLSSNNNNKYSIQCMEYYRDPQQNKIRGLVLSSELFFTGSSFYEVIPPYYQSQKRSYYDFNSNEEGVFRARLPVYFLVFVNEQNKIIGWREAYQTEESTAAKRYLLATENTVSVQEESRYLPIMVDESFTKSVSFAETDKMKAAQEKGIEAYKYLIHLNKDCSNDYFDGFYALCSPGLKSQLQSAGILEQMLQDAQKYNVTIALDPVSASKAETLSTGFIKGYKDTIYGDVYIIEKYVYMQSGSEAFNQKYALPPDKGNATFRFYISYNEGTPQLVAFRINASSQLSPFENYDQIWAGNWDNG